MYVDAIFICLLTRRSNGLFPSINQIFEPVCISEHLGRLFSFQGTPRQLVLQMWMSSHQKCGSENNDFAVSSSHLYVHCCRNWIFGTRTIPTHVKLPFPIIRTWTSSFSCDNSYMNWHAVDSFCDYRVLRCSTVFYHWIQPSAEKC